MGCVFGGQRSPAGDLENLTTDVNLELQCCLLEEGVLARDARLASVTLRGCQIESPAQPPLDGANLTCSVVDLGWVRVIGHIYLGGGAVDLTGAHIGGRLSFAGADLRNDSGPALDATTLQVDQNMNLAKCTATGSDRLGAVRLSGAHIGGVFNCAGADLRNDTGPALLADGLYVEQAMFLTDGFTATGAGRRGAVTGAHIGGQLACVEADLRNDTGPALDADSLHVGQHLYLNVFKATGGGEDVVVYLTGAQVDGAFTFAPARLKHEVDYHRRLLVDGLTYVGVPDTGFLTHGWLGFLRMAPPAMRRSHTSNWPPDTGHAATTGTPATP